jgi:magnesium transporter
MSNYKKPSDNIQEIIIDNPKTPNDQLEWINIGSGGKKEIEYLRKRFNFDMTDLQAASAKTVSQRPRIRRNDNYVFLILHFPIMKEGKIVAEEIEFFLGHGFLVTVHNNHLRELNEFFNYCKKEGDSLLAYKFESSAILLYELLHKLLISCYDLLDKNSIAINNAEKIIFEEEQKKAVTEILSLRRNIVNLRKVMQNHKNIMKKLMVLESSIVPHEEIKKYYNKLIEHSKRIWEILENQKEIIEVLHETNASLLNYKISDIMKTLTIFSVLMLPLTLLAAIFGMNTINGMPLVNNASGFWIVIAVMVTASLCMLLVFERKKWL